VSRIGNESDSRATALECEPCSPSLRKRRITGGGTVAVYSNITELKRREHSLAEKSTALEALSGKFAKYLAPQVYDSIFTERQEVRIASQRKKRTVCFSDIAGFTEAADKMESEELTQLLNRYLTEMSLIASEYGATIDKYVGDAIVMFFGDPESRGIREDALACVTMALAMQKRMGELAQVWMDAGMERRSGAGSACTRITARSGTLAARPGWTTLLSAVP
jgi:adenylate cyclase